VVTWPVYARLVRGQVLTIKEREYIQAARALGIPQGRILLRHVLPNSLAPLLVQASFDLGSAILLAVACFNLLGDGLRDFLDPQLRGR